VKGYEIIQNASEVNSLLNYWDLYVLCYFIVQVQETIKAPGLL